MANKYQLINEMASETLKEITQNGESWIKFLIRRVTITSILLMSKC